MAFDDPTRRLLQRFVNEARKELELEFTRQLQLVYGMDPGTGAVSPLDKLSNITDAQRETARILRDILAHYAAAPGADAKSALTRVLREQAFTVLNRLCALRLAEARGLLIESVGNGYQAKGFQLYQHLAGTGLGETGDAYRVYLFSVFDELAVDLPSLFDRYSPQGRLFPREAALLQVLALVNNPELESLWAEDETIGWIYQYFNSKEERKAMRAVRAPRNSRELAVRNQFFTPRYVVEFLTDNTLGRTWHEMTQGESNLKDQCRYMLIRPREVFLAPPDEYREEPRAEWINKLRQGNFSAMPEEPTWDEISSVALSIDGYKVAESLGERVLNTVSRVDDGEPGQAPEFEVSPNGLVDQWVQSHERGEVFSSDPLVLWLVLFGWQRGVLRESRDPDGTPETAQLIRETYAQLRAALQVDCAVAPATGERDGVRGELSQEERLKRPVFVPHRAIKDPRELKILDPACGSGHFLLYAFDLLLTIYAEAWERGFIKPSDYGHTHGGAVSWDEAKAEYLRQVPRLIIEHNLYGVDIDPRAAQIASLALWLRAQRAWHEAGIKAKDRPAVGHGHIIAAVAPPADKELREEFIGGLSVMDAELFGKTLDLLKGLPELGVLLQVEQELPRLIRQVFGEHGDLWKEDDLAQWEKAEARLREALAAFAQAAKATYQGRLFAQDALQGLRMIDLCRERFDVVLMNPPFGEPSVATKRYLEYSFPQSSGNIFAHFIDRSMRLISQGGRLGVILSRTCFFLQSFTTFRQTVLNETLSLECFADLGSGVLDAMVESAATTWEKSCDLEKDAYFFRQLSIYDKSMGIRESIYKARLAIYDNYFFNRKLSQFSIFDDRPYIYWIDASIANKIAAHPSIEPTACTIRVGLQTGDDLRFLRLWWEVDVKQIVVPIVANNINILQEECIHATRIKKWAWFSKTEFASPFLSSIHLVVNWSINGSEIKAYHVGNGHSASKYVMSESMYFRPGLSYMLRSSRLVPYIVPNGVIPTASRSQVYPQTGEEVWLATLLASNLATAIARFRGGYFSGPKFQNSMVGSIPYLRPSTTDLENSRTIVLNVQEIVKKRLKADETEIYFSAPELTEFIEPIIYYNKETILGKVLDARIAESCGLTDKDFQIVQRDLEEALSIPDSSYEESSETSDDIEIEEQKEPRDLDFNSRRLSWCVGVLFGRFDWRLATGERQAPPEPQPFDPLPAKSPGMLPDGDPSLHENNGILVDDPGHPHDLVRLVEEVLARVEVPVPGDLRRWLQRDLFPFHLQMYSKSRRKAPIYWPLSTASGSYTLWVYYPRLSAQTLYTAINDFVDPKLKQVGADAAALRNKGAARTREDEKQYESLQAFELELTELRDTLLKIAPTYHPNQDDGVQITAAPLWMLFRHRPWQKLLKETWAKLEKGDYDWAHLSLSYWPHRVVRTAHKDRSIAIAHDLEDQLWEEVEVEKKTKGGKITKTKVWQPRELSAKQLDAIAEGL